MDCNKSKYKSIKDFPEQWHEILFMLDAKNDVLNQLLTFEEMRENNPNHTGMSWADDIARIGVTMSNLLSKLPHDVLDAYLKYRYIQDLLHQASVLTYNGKFNEAKDIWAKVKELECCGKEEHCG